MTDFSLKGKNALLTGAAGFFGRYFAEALAESGVRRLYLIDRNNERLFQLRESLKGKFNKGMVVHVYARDLYDCNPIGHLFNAIASNYKIDILINNAFDFSKRTGFNTSEGRLENATYDQLRSCFEAGIYWAIQTTQTIGLKMKERGGGSIINICSMYGVVVPSPDLYEGTDIFNPPGYSMAKAGLLQFTKYAASFLSPEVRVNAISPGAIPNLENPTDNPSSDVILDRLLKKILLKRVGHPKDLTGAMIFLASDASSYITGQNIIIDGGLTVT